MGKTSSWPGSIELSLQGRHLVFLFIGSALALFLVFLAGIALGKRLPDPTIPSTPQNMDEKQLDCIDWLQKQIEHKTGDFPY